MFVDMQKFWDFLKNFNKKKFEKKSTQIELKPQEIE